jgi:hypothetical protein
MVKGDLVCLKTEAKEGIFGLYEIRDVSYYQWYELYNGNKIMVSSDNVITPEEAYEYILGYYMDLKNDIDNKITKVLINQGLLKLDKCKFLEEYIDWR